jgi:hypothetical protein
MMGNPNPINPNTKPQDDKEAEQQRSFANRSNRNQQCEGRDPAHP